MRKLFILLPMTILLYPVGLAVHANVPSIQMIPASSIQQLADDSWEGLSMEEQQYLTSINASDETIIAFRDSLLNPCMEDMPCWNCSEMGNKVCGNPSTPAPIPVVLAELPRTS